MQHVKAPLEQKEQKGAIGAKELIRQYKNRELRDTAPQRKDQKCFGY